MLPCVGHVSTSLLKIALINIIWLLKIAILSSSKIHSSKFIQSYLRYQDDATNFGATKQDLNWLLILTFSEGAPQVMSGISHLFNSPTEPTDLAAAFLGLDTDSDRSQLR